MSDTDDDEPYVPPRMVTAICPRGHVHEMVIFVPGDFGTLELAACPDDVPYADMPRDKDGFSYVPGKEAGKA